MRRREGDYKDQLGKERFVNFQAITTDALVFSIGELMYT